MVKKVSAIWRSLSKVQKKFYSISLEIKNIFGVNKIQNVQKSFSTNDANSVSRSLSKLKRISFFAILLKKNSFLNEQHSWQKKQQKNYGIIGMSFDPYDRPTPLYYIFVRGCSLLLMMQCAMAEQRRKEGGNRNGCWSILSFIQGPVI